jgi:hypothetical protein
MNETNNGILAWHFLRDDRRLQFPPCTLVEPGQTLRVEPPLRMCRHGLHASARAIDALRYAPGDMVCRVRLSGEILTDEDKLCASERTVLWMVDATTTLHEFACWCAEQALEQERAAGREPDPRSWAAIKTKRAWLRGECDDATLAAAEAAATLAAADAAAWAAAWAADAADAAADAAAWAAAWAAAAAAREEQNAELERRLMELKPREGEKSDG